MALRHVLFDMKLFDTHAERSNSQGQILWLLEALTHCNQLFLQQHPETPLMYQSGIKYKLPEQFEHVQVPEIDTIEKFLDAQGAPDEVRQALQVLADMTGSGENFREIPRIIENGGGDCDNLACWRAAELRQLGVDAKPYLTWRERPDGGATYHVTVLWPDGGNEDPSRLLGMGGDAPEAVAAREEEQRKLGERCGGLLKALQSPSIRGELYSPLATSDDTKQRMGTAAPLAEAIDKAARGEADVIAPLNGGVRENETNWERRLDQAMRTVQVFGAAIQSAQDYSQLQYSIPFQNDDSYADWSPVRPQAYYADPRYPHGGLILGTGGGPIFNTTFHRPRNADVAEIVDEPRGDYGE